MKEALYVFEVSGCTYIKEMFWWEVCRRIEDPSRDERFVGVSVRALTRFGRSARG